MQQNESNKAIKNKVKNQLCQQEIEKQQIEQYEKLKMATQKKIRALNRFIHIDQEMLYLMEPKTILEQSKIQQNNIQNSSSAKKECQKQYRSLQQNLSHLKMSSEKNMNSTKNTSCNNDPSSFNTLLNLYAKYCYTCDQFIKLEDLLLEKGHICRTNLSRIQILDSRLQKVIEMIVQLQMPEFLLFPRMIVKQSNYAILNEVYQCLREKRRYIEQNKIINMEQIKQTVVLKRLINICGKKMGFVI